MDEETDVTLEELDDLICYIQAEFERAYQRLMEDALRAASGMDG